MFIVDVKQKIMKIIEIKIVIKVELKKLFKIKTSIRLAVGKCEKNKNDIKKHKQYNINACKCKYFPLDI